MPETVRVTPDVPGLPGDLLRPAVERARAAGAPARPDDGPLGEGGSGSAGTSGRRSVALPGRTAA